MNVKCFTDMHLATGKWGAGRGRDRQTEREREREGETGKIRDDDDT